MTFTVTCRAKDGALREERVDAAGGRSNLLRLDVAKHVVAERPLPAEELLFRSGEWYAFLEFEFKKVQCADEVCHLKEPVAGRLHGGHELNGAFRTGSKCMVEQVRDLGLPAVVVDLDAADAGEPLAVCGDEFGEGSGQPGDYLVGGIYETLVHMEAVIRKVDSARERHHAGEYAAAELPAEHGVVLLAADEWACVEAVPFEADHGVGLFKERDFAGDVHGLVVEHHGKDVETGVGIGKFEVPRLVNEHAQGSGIHESLKKREWRDANPATHAESFPRIPVTPPMWGRSSIIVPNRAA